MNWLYRSWTGRTLLAAIVLCGLIVALILLRKDGAFDHPASVTIVVAGNIDLRRPSAEAIVARAEFLEDLANLDEAQLVMANLQTPIPASGETPVPGKESIWKSDASSLPMLQRIHLTDVGLANNHAFDYALPGIASTKAQLESISIGSAGAGVNEVGAAKPIIRKIVDHGGNAFTMAIFPMLVFERKLETQSSYFAGPGSPGVAEIDIETFRNSVDALRRTDPHVFVIAYPHWGSACGWRTASQRSTARSLIDAGADLVAGVGPRVVQEVEHYHGRWIAYGLGTLVGASVCSQGGEEELLNNAAFLEIGFSANRPMRPEIAMHILTIGPARQLATASGAEVEAVANTLRTRRLDRRTPPPISVKYSPQPSIELQ